MNQKGLDLIKQFEGCSLTSYRCPAGILTIGYGHTGNVQENELITQYRADDLLSQDVSTTYNEVQSLVKLPLTDNQISALTCLAYNIGIGNFSKSTLLKELNNNNLGGIAPLWLEWNRVAGVINKGLVRRRAAELALFMEG